MSGTDYFSLKAPATDVIVVSHGQPSDPAPAEAELAELTARVAAQLQGWRLHSATLASPGALVNALDACNEAPLIYPLFMTDGWFTQSVLPKRTAGRAARILPPLGTDSALPQLASDLLKETLAAKNWHAGDTCLIIAAHGSGRSPNSARATKHFAQAIGKTLSFGEIRLGFIEEPPYLGEVVFDTGPQTICLPFFATIGGHVIDDIPRALDHADYPGPRLDPIGTDPGVPELIATALQDAACSASHHRPLK
ncbi:CbiX/SirB N-terminal domain-containing protein [Pontibaca salina]|uniref:Cobalamin biosynthesis protein CbiX n=1 Tax=Pontibaca salina TaxID=2795731 RepID=A0A934LZR5_9RHOB|nr:CbiX/SirB N-terminal domain-containing protein [Pontibaca salina]MBI6628963.1 cobalamin biosynthesis protein CbiX [Pontibaca salina]